MDTEESLDRMAEESEPAPAAPGSIVVGHDGSADAQAALEMAMEMAGKLGRPVLMVRAWSIVTAPRPAAWSAGYVPPFDEFAAAVKDEMLRHAGPVAQKFPDVEISYLPVHAAPLKALVAISRDAYLLVLGTRGRGGLQGMRLGSVSGQCMRHGQCSVLVVRART